MRKERDRQGLVVKISVAISVILALALLYILVVQPSFAGYVVQAQNQGVEWAIVSIMQQAAQCQQVPLTYQNQTINLVAVECLQQAQQAQQTPSEQTPVQ